MVAPCVSYPISTYGCVYIVYNTIHYCIIQDPIELQRLPLRSRIPIIRRTQTQNSSQTEIRNVRMVVCILRINFNT